VAEAASRRVVEESLGDAVIRGIDAFVFRDIEDEVAALAVFDFVDDLDARRALAGALRGARWQQKVGFVLASRHGHPAHSVLIRSQVIEFGALVELTLREVVRQHRPGSLPSTFQGLIQRASSIGLLDERGVAAAERRRAGRNGVHLDPADPPLKLRDSAKALRDAALVINQCRAHAGLGTWRPVRPASNGAG
jgi:hypothetical protein